MSEDLVEGQGLEERIGKTAYADGYIKLNNARLVFERIGIVGQEQNVSIVRNMVLLPIDVNVGPKDGFLVFPSSFHIPEGEGLKTINRLMEEAKGNEMTARAQRAGIEIPNINTMPKGPPIQ